MRAPAPAALGRATLGPRGLALLIDGLGRARRDGLRGRLVTLLDALDGTPDPDASTATLLRGLDEVLTGREPDQLWLSLAVLTGELPTPVTVTGTAREARLDGPLAALSPALRGRLQEWTSRTWAPVEVAVGAVVVDVHHTARVDLATGIQRVTRQASARWARDHDPVFVGWDERRTSLCRLDAASLARALHGTADVPTVGHEPAREQRVLVPWQCTYVLPELMAEPDRAIRLKALVEHSRSETAVIGHDCVPLSAAETTAEGMSGGFAVFLAALAHVDRIATVSAASAAEFVGWRRMLSGTGLPGPRVQPIPLAVEAEQTTPEALAEARALLTVGEQPMVLVVGSHEPRKNHLAVLHAAELLWRDGHRFTVNFVGGNSWNSRAFATRLADLRAAGRPVQSITALSDRLLWAAYRVARCTLFPSLSEGFGLPVGESLACGTPVITSGFGSMAETSVHGGALAVDPRDDRSIANALRRLLTDDALHARLSAEASAAPGRTWDDYASETWEFLVCGKVPTALAEVTG